MNAAIHTDPVTPALLWLDTGEQEDELAEAEREEKEARENGDDEPDEDLIKQERLNKH
jgi:hypothetical protein